MEMCRFKAATDSGYSDFKAALTGYLADIQAKEAAQAAQANGLNASHRGS